MKALGLIEVYGLVTAIEALDAAVKAANVTRLGITQVKGGLVCVQVTGDVGATRAAIDAAAAAAAKVGKVVAVHVIPRPAESMADLLSPQGPGQGQKQPPADLTSESPQASGQAAGAQDREPWPEPEPEPEPAPAVPAHAEPAHAEPANGEPVDDLDHLTVAQLRTLARETGVNTLSKRDIRFAKKEELLEAIRQFREQGS